MSIKLAILAAGLCVTSSAAATAVIDWNNAALAEVRVSKLGPPIVARALAVAHTCMYDAWVAYDANAIATLGSTPRRPAGERTGANKAKAISFAAYRCLLNLFPAGAARLGAIMTGLGYDPTDTSIDVTTPQGIGNLAAARLIAYRRNDGSNQYGDLGGGAPYADYTGYVPRNPALPFCTPETVGLCPPQIISDPFHWQPLISDLGVTQVFIAPHWERVTPFALLASNQYDKQIPPPDIFAPGMSRYQANVDQMLQFSAALDLERKVIVEYWADGPASELPPGHWGLFAQFVSQRDQNSIDDDVKMFFAMHNASFDAGIVAWHIKRLYDGVRPITAVRYLKQGTKVIAWGRPGRPTESIPGEKWIPYNPGSNLTPSFPGYFSGHSTFSSASATVLQLFTESDVFGFSTVIPPNFGRVEPGIPPVPTTLTYPTFSGAAGEAGLSRLFGGIHFVDDNTVGQRIGALIGEQAWTKAQLYFNGLIAVDSTSSATQANETSTLSWSHTVGTADNRLLLVGVSYRDGNQPLLGVSYGGQPLTRLGAQNGPGNQNRVEIWFLFAPAPGTANVVVTLTNARHVVGGATSFAAVDQTAPFSAFQSNTGQTAAVSLRVASAVDQVVFSMIAANGDSTGVVVKAGQQQLWNAGSGVAGGDIRGAASAIPGAPSVSLSYALAVAKPWVLGAVGLLPALKR